MKRIFAFHLLNDYSGSPKVLSQLVKGWSKAGYTVVVHTSTKKTGFLSDITNVEYYDNNYIFYPSIPLRLFSMMWSQLMLIIKMYYKIDNNDIIYINTLLPFGAALLGKIKGARVIYHIHETSIKPLIFKKFLLFFVKFCATEVIYVSDFLAQQEPLNLPSHILWNAIEDDFVSIAQNYKIDRSTFKNVLMIASLKKYKGVDEFVLLARKCSEMNFELVVNASKQEISIFFDWIHLPANLKIFASQDNVHPFYQRADIVMNLSRPDEWKETFGLTALEAMAYGIPVIVPTVGGISEIVLDGVTGFHIDGFQTTKILKKLELLRDDADYYRRLSSNAINHAHTFSESIFIEKNLAVIHR